MLDVFGSVRGLLKIDAVCIDNNIFRLHYKVTCIILVACSLLVTARQYIGDPIDCVVDGVPPHIMDSFCWITSTFTVPKFISGRVGKNVVHPGVAPHVEGEDDVKHHKYYQWVCFVLFFQSVFFCLPRHLWKLWEGGRINTLVQDINCPIVSNECKNDRKKLLVDYLVHNLHAHNFYAVRFFLCELLNFVNVIAQIFAMDYFLEGEFSTYGLDVLRFTDMNPDDREDPMARVFPKVTKCTFFNYGPTGTIQKLDGLCVLPLNIVNEKIYVFLWFWFLFIAVLSGLNLVYRTAVVCMPKFRLVLLKAQCRLAVRNDIETIVKKCQIGDWFMMSQLAKNIDPLIFKELLSELAMRLDGKQSV